MGVFIVVPCRFTRQPKRMAAGVYAVQFFLNSALFAALLSSCQKTGILSYSKNGQAKKRMVKNFETAGRSNSKRRPGAPRQYSQGGRIYQPPDGHRAF